MNEETSPQVELLKQGYEFVDAKIRAVDRDLKAFDGELARSRQQLSLPPGGDGGSDHYAPSGGATGWGGACLTTTRGLTRGTPLVCATWGPALLSLESLL